MTDPIHFNNNRFYLGDDPDTAPAYLDIVPVGNRAVRATHTFVSDSLRGQGVAKRLLTALVEEARRSDWRIIADCSYVADAFAKAPDLYDDVRL